MSRPRFLADHDFNERILDGVLVREPVVEVMRCREVGLQRASDPDILAYAAANGFIVLSHDVNSLAGAAHARLVARAPLPGVFLVLQERAIGPIIESLIIIWTASEAEEWRDRVIFLPI